MDKEHIEVYMESCKQVVVFLRNSLIYTCEILSVMSDSTLIRDKYGKLVSIDNHLIERIEECH